tara:strand:+ start:208 stop:339 length:132 start_codon:yes stop_codon:yes gene_type:complete
VVVMVLDGLPQITDSRLVKALPVVLVVDHHIICQPTLEQLVVV